MIKDNKGSTLITVIVAIAFVTILTSIILSVTAMNMSMKGIDRKVKDDFYYAEKGLNDVYIGVGQVAAKRVGKRYDDAFEKIGESYDTADDAYKAFKKNFLEDCYKEYKDTDPGNRKNKLNAYIVTSLPARLKSIEVTGADAAMYRDNKGKVDTAYSDETVAVVIPNVTVAATDKEDYRSVIKSDIVIECPTVDFLGTNAEITDYSLIACQGVYFTGDATGKYIDVNGNLYGGIHPTASTKTYGVKTYVDDGNILNTTTFPFYGGINVFNSSVKLRSNQIVSKGDINISGTGSNLEIGSNEMVSSIPGVWFDSMRTVKGATSPKAEIRANLFALNDLELNADGSDVRLVGGYDYYGYNDKTLGAGSFKNTEHSLAFPSDGKRKDEDSSSIIINGNKCKLDLSDVHTLVLMGKAFVDFESKGTVVSGDKTVASAEGLALQTNQQLYVVPTEFLTNPNPSTAENLTIDPDSGARTFVTNMTRGELDTDYPVEGTSSGWFGYRYVKQTKTDDDNWDKTVNDIFDIHVIKIGGVDVYYAYLKFNDDTWVKSGGKYIPAMYEDPDTHTMKRIPINKVGTGGSVSSKTAFFDEIMSADASAADDPAEVQPSPSRLKKKVLRSLENDEHFDLRGCVVNNSSSAVIYGRNAIVHYSTPGYVADYHADPPSPTPSPTPTVEYKVKYNTEGMERFANYPDNLLQRYQLLCVYLDSREGTPLSTSISLSGTPKQAKINSDWKKDIVTSPMDNFVIMTALTGKNTSADSEKYIAGSEAFGACVAYDSAANSNKPYIIEADDDFKGVALIKGDIIIESGAKVEGLLMATGTITVEGGSSSSDATTIKANKGIVQSRIEKEISLVEDGSDYKDNFLISYLTNDGTNRMYNVTKGGRKKEDRIGADYNVFMHYENWSKTE